jgi:hypothetical protein
VCPHCEGWSYEDCGFCDYGRIILSGEAVFEWKDPAGQWCHDGTWLCGDCAFPKYPFELRMQ